MMSKIDLTAAYDFVEQMNGAIGEIRFVKKPDSRLLGAIADQAVGKTPVLLSFDATLPLGYVDDVASETWSHQIKSACLQSDVFCEESYNWFEFSRMERLTIQAQLPNRQAFWDDEDLMTFQHAISEGMRELQELRFVLACGDDAFSQAQAALTWPYAKFTWSVERRSLTLWRLGRR